MFEGPHTCHARRIPVSSCEIDGVVMPYYPKVDPIDGQMRWRQPLAILTRLNSNFIDFQLQFMVIATTVRSHRIPAVNAIDTARTQGML